jgi:hypothetical protein
MQHDPRNILNRSPSSGFSICVLDMLPSTETLRSISLLCCAPAQVEFQDYIMSGRCNTGSKSAAGQGGQSEEEGRWAHVLQASTHLPFLSCDCSA